LRNTTESSTQLGEIEEFILQPTARVGSIQKTETGAREQHAPAPDPVVDELIIQRILAALMAEE
jgi:hypothetical protein